jgi:glycerol-3-phosphate dehydrogenase
MGRVAIIGGGAFGTGMACVARRSGNEVTLRALPVVSCSKGVEQKSCQFMPEVLADMFPDAIVAVLSGPSFAKDIGADLPCGVVVACHDWGVAEMLARSLANPHFCVHLSDDVIGTAVAGAGDFMNTARSLQSRNFKVEMPITLALDAILGDQVALEDAIKLVMRTMPALWRTGKAGTREVLHV